MDTVQSMQFTDDLLSGKLAIPPSLLVQIDVISRMSSACTQEDFENQAPMNLMKPNAIGDLGGCWAR
jgi:hypothetical protein